jgi:putative DNA-invertase from lambdoid prophage Rac
MRITPYARVSTDEQTNENQLWQLKAYMQQHPEHTYTEVIQEKETTRKFRPEKDKLMSQLRQKQIDGVLMVELSRWGRSVKELINDMDEFIKNGWQLISLKESIDLTTSQGRFVANLFASLYNLERDLISDRTVHGINRARMEGKIIGRHPTGCGCGQKPKHTGEIRPIWGIQTLDDGREIRVCIAWGYPNGGVLPVNYQRKGEQGWQRV